MENEVAMRRAAALTLLRLLLRKSETYCPFTGSGPAGKVASGTRDILHQRLKT